MSSLYDQPDEVLMNMSRYLSGSDINRFSQVSRRSYAISIEQAKRHIEDVIGEPIDCYKSNKKRNDCRWILDIKPTFENLQILSKENRKAGAYLYLTNPEVFKDESINSMLNLLITSDNIRAFETYINNYIPVARDMNVLYPRIIITAILSRSDNILNMLYHRIKQISNHNILVSITCAAILENYWYVFEYILNNDLLDNIDINRIIAYSAIFGKLKAFIKLLDIGANLPSLANMLETIKKHRYNIISYVLEEDLYGRPDINNMFYEAMLVGDSKMIKIFMQYGMDLYQHRNSFISKSMYNKEIFDAFLNHGYDPSHIGVDDITNAIYATYNPISLEMFDYVISKATSITDYHELILPIAYAFGYEGVQYVFENLIDEFPADIDNFILEEFLDQKHSILDYYEEKDNKISYDTAVKMLQKSLSKFNIEMTEHMIKDYHVNINEVESSVLYFMIDDMLRDISNESDIDYSRSSVRWKMIKLVLDGKIISESDYEQILDLVNKYAHVSYLDHELLVYGIRYGYR